MPPRPPDDALARLARWDELRRRAAAGRAEVSADGSPAAHMPPGARSLPGAQPPPGLRSLPAAQPPPAAVDPLRTASAPPAEPPLPVVDDLIRTARELAERHPTLSLAVEAEDAGVVWRLRIARTPDGPQVILETDKPGPPAASAAARLAELLRENPGILDASGP